jgi:hypothetical protein
MKAAELDMEFIVAEGRFEADSPLDAVGIAFAKEGLEERPEGIDTAFEMQTIHDEFARAGEPMSEEQLQSIHAGINIGISIGKTEVANPRIMGLLLKDMPEHREMNEEQKEITDWIAGVVRAFGHRPAIEPDMEGGDADVGDDN